jgi:hypothetical protein
MYIGYLLALGSAIGVAEAAHEAAMGRTGFNPGGACAIPVCSLVLGGEIWLLAAVLPSGRARWKKLLREAGKPPWYGFAVGAVCGCGIGACCGILIAADVDRWRIIALVFSFLGPIPGVAWVYRLKPAPDQADYDDQMRE